MIEFENENYYSVTELEEIINDGNHELLRKKLCEVYKKDNDYYFDERYIQGKLYPAIELKIIKHLEYEKKNYKKTFKAFALKDIDDFLKHPWARHVCSKKYQNIKNIKLIEVGA